ncbi:DEAD/DEAH box helicase family protein [Nibrella viscosa]|uniref:DEAD/DEAH box helicase family protein n=1 Tax=Nibrella viscosa TaxID=1084524 RepID=A0ABP8KY69_9BACT
MELKPYQQSVINDLSLFLDQLQQTNGRVREAFYDFWLSKGFRPFPGTAIEPYKNNVKDGADHPVPHICLKVPTAGGKTFIACNALRTIFEKVEPGAVSANVVVWLVPSNSILQQTILNLRNPAHPYRQKINSHFQNRVEVFDKQAMLSGAGFNATTVQGQLSIIVMSFDSLRARNKEDRKLYQENGNNISFAQGDTTNPYVLEGTDETAVINVIRSLSPVVVVDESHNAESELSVEMLRNLNPSFILDLTATPRKNSNIISFVDALELKKENMVKLPVIVYNQKKERTEVINSALSLQRRLELLANDERKQGGRYIRPIVLFQAQPKTSEDNQTFEKIKETLIRAGIPSDQIKIKTASIDELKGINLMSPECPVRYIITVNALKEGWDCPFAYILASLADRSSAVDVEQILGRVLRQPHVMRHKSPLLNLSYVLTASSRFRETLQNVVNGLNKAGFSARDYRAIDETSDSANQPVAKAAGDPLELLFTLPAPTPEASPNNGDAGDELDPAAIHYAGNIAANGSANAIGTDITAIEQKALAEATEYDERIKQMSDTPSALPPALTDLVDQYRIKDQFQELAGTIRLPQFFQRVSTGIFGDEELLLRKEALLADFNLRKADRNIDFGSVDSELYKVDLEEAHKGEYTPRFSHIDGQTKDALLANILPNQTREGQIKTMTKQMLRRLGNLKPISDKDIEWYVRQVLEDLTEAQFQDLIAQEFSYSERIRQKIESLTTTHAEKTFRLWLDQDKLFLRPSYALPATISPTETGKDIIKSLYVHEAKCNPFEEKVIDAIANLESVAFWTRNLERGRGFVLNGFINHYPDFIVVTKRGKIILVETKGDHLDNTDTAEKIRLGNFWRSKAGNDYRYYMVFETKEVPDAVTLATLLGTIREL